MKKLDAVKLLACMNKAGLRPRYDVNMKGFTSLKIGGTADVFIDVGNIYELKEVIKFAHKNRIPVFVLGKGTNILVKDKGIRGIVIRLRKEFEKINFYGSRVKTGAGSLLSKLIRESTKRGLAGLECMAGIPGTVGGACLINAGTREGEIGDRIINVICLTKEGKVRKINKKDIKFEYRHTDLPERKLIITEVEMELYRDKRENCENRIMNFLNRRKQTQPLNFPNAGCIFKNPASRLSAGALIENAGLKGKRVGDIEISVVHANFIINRGDGTARDVIRIIKLIESKVKREFDIQLEKEIIIVGE